MGYRWVARETVREYFARRRKEAAGAWPGEYETIHPSAAARNPLPRNVEALDQLPADRGWWGYSFRDVPARISGETFLATIPNCTLAFYFDGQRDFHPGILNMDNRALSLREVAFRPGHAKVLRSSASPLRVEKASWIIERVYHNHSHWLTAHLPKICLLKSRSQLDNLILPADRNAVMDSSLRMLGLDAARFPTFDVSRPLEVRELTLLGTDRFRPELLRPVREAIGIPPGKPPHRRVFISRSRSARRRLVNESQVWPILRDAGFEQVFMEDLKFDQQVRLMGETAILFAPHGAGLTNMMFCYPGAQVIEIADLSFPNPNFYALACAMGLHYWLLPGEGLGDVHPLEKDLRVEPGEVARIAAALEM